MTVDRQQRKPGRDRMLLLTLIVRLPRLDDRASDGLAARGEHTTLDIHVLPFPFRRDRLAERDCGRNGA